MKPREFWITGNGVVFNFCPTPEMEIKTVIHVREVVPIDWISVWLKIGKSSDGFYLTNHQETVIRETIEKQLAGDTGLTPVEKEKL